MLSATQTMVDINDRYGVYLWKLSNRYSVGSLSPEDVYHELLLAGHRSLSSEKLSLDNKKRCKSFFITSAIDVCRKELRHLKRQTLRGWNEESDCRTGRHVVLPDDSFAEDETREMIECLLSPRDAMLVCELIWPSNKTYILVRREATAKKERLKEDSCSGRNCADPVNAIPQKRHVAAVCGVSPATVSRAFTNLRHAAEDLLRG